MSDSATRRTTAHQASLNVRRQLPEFTQIHVHRVGDAIQPSQPLSSPSPPTLILSQHQGVSRCVSLSHQVAKVLEFSFSISPSKEQSGLISIRMGFELCLSCALGWPPRAPLRSRLASLHEPALCRARLPAGSPVFEFFPRGTRYFWTRRGGGGGTVLGHAKVTTFCTGKVCSFPLRARASPAPAPHSPAPRRHSARPGSLGSRWPDDPRALRSRSREAVRMQPPTERRRNPPARGRDDGACEFPGLGSRRRSAGGGRVARAPGHIRM